MPTPGDFHASLNEMEMVLSLDEKETILNYIKLGVRFIIQTLIPFIWT